MVFFLGLKNLFLQKDNFNLAMDLFIEMNWKYLPNAPSLGHIPYLDWSWIHLMLWPLGNMKEDHGLPSLVPTKILSFSSLLETDYHENLHTIQIG